MRPHVTAALATAVTDIGRALVEFGRVLADEAATPVEEATPVVVVPPVCPLPHVSEETSPEHSVPGTAVLRPREVAEILRVHPQTVYRWVKEGVLAAVPKGKTGYVVPVGEVQRLLKEAVDKAAQKRAQPGVT